MTILTMPIVDVGAGLSTPSGAKLNFYEAGTTTRLATYTDSALSVAHTNPVVADGNGVFAAIYLQNKEYKIVLTDSDDVVIWTVDPYYTPIIDFVDDVTALKLIEGVSEQVIFLKGLTAVNDSGEGYFYWNAASSATADDENIIQATGVATGRWLRMYQGHVDSIDSLPTNSYDGAVVNVASWYDIKPSVLPDGGGGQFVWDSAGDAADHDGVSIFDPNHSITPGATGYWTAETGTGVWRRIFDESQVSDRWAGTKVDGSTDDTEATQAYIQFCIDNDRREAVFSPGTRMITDSLITPARSQPNLAIKGTGRNCKFYFRPDSATTPLHDLQGIDYMVFENFAAIGDYNYPASFWHMGNSNRHHFSNLWLCPVDDGVNGDSDYVFAWKHVDETGSGVNQIINTYTNIYIGGQGSTGRNGAVVQAGSLQGMFGWGMDDTLTYANPINLHASKWKNIHVEGCAGGFWFPHSQAAQNCRFDGMMMQGNADGQNWILNNTSTTISGKVLTDTTASWTTNAYKYMVLQIVSGSYAGQARIIQSNTANTITVDYDFDDTTNADYVVRRYATNTIGAMVNCFFDCYMEELTTGKYKVDNYFRTTVEGKFSGFMSGLTAFGNTSSVRGNIITGQPNGLYLGTDTINNAIREVNVNSGLTIGQKGLFHYSKNNIVEFALNGTSGNNYTEQNPFVNSFVSVYLSSTQSNKTGTGTTYNIPFDTEITDIGGNFDTGTNTYTAPIDGNYLITVATKLSGITSAATSIELVINVNPTPLNFAQQTSGATDFIEEPQVQATAIVYMAAGTTFKPYVEVTGEAGDVVDILGGGTPKLTHMQIQCLG